MYLSIEIALSPVAPLNVLIRKSSNVFGYASSCRKRVQMSLPAIYVDQSQ